MSKLVKTTTLFVLFTAFLGCSPGLFAKMGSTAPSFGPIFVGMTRAEAERYLGCPVTIMPIDDGSYRSIYEYEIERSNRSILSADIMDFMTFGLGNLILSPVDRFNGTKHLMAVVYKRADIYEEDDQVVAITNRFKKAIND